MNNNQEQKHHNYLSILFIAIILVFLGIVYLVILQHQQLVSITKEGERLTNELALSTKNLIEMQASSSILATKLIQTEKLLTDNTESLAIERKRNDDFENQISGLAGTIGILDKVAKTDPELLQKYSKVYFLNENYIPSKIKQINQEYILADKGDQYFQGDALPFLYKMIGASIKAGVDLKIVSAYRSFETQSDLKGQYSQIYGTGANTFSADQGYSEHQLGTTVDLTDAIVAGTSLNFKDSEAYLWLQKNAYKYGFVLSYPEGNSFYVFEPWHWRFVGVELASDLNRAKANFYDWDQRKIDEYLVSLFD